MKPTAEPPSHPPRRRETFPKHFALPPPLAASSIGAADSANASTSAPPSAEAAAAAAAAESLEAEAAAREKAALPFWDNATWDEVRDRLGPDYFESGRLCSLITTETLVRFQCGYP